MEIEFDENYDKLDSMKNEIEALKREMNGYIQDIAVAAEIPRTC